MVSTTLAAPHRNDPAASRRWMVFAVLAAAYMWAFFQRICPGILAVDIMHALNGNESMVALIVSATFYPYALMQLPSGLLADRWGARYLVTLSLALTAVGCLMFGMATTASAAVVARVITGFGVSLIFVPALATLSRWFPASRYAMICSLMLALTGASTLLAGAPLAWTAEHWGWRESFYGLAIISLGLAAATWFLVRNAPPTPPLDDISPAHTSASTNIQETSAVPIPDKIGLAAVCRTILCRPSYGMLCLWYFLNGGLFFSFAGLWLGPYLMNAYGMNTAGAGAVISSLCIGQTGGPLLFGTLASRLRSRAFLLGSSMVIAAADILVLSLFNGTLPLWAVFVCVILFSLSIVGPSGVVMAAARELFPPRLIGTVSGLLYFCCILGSIVFQTISGLMLNAAGGGNLTAAAFDGFLHTLVGMSLVAATAGFIYHRLP